MLISSAASSMATQSPLTSLSLKSSGINALALDTIIGPCMLHALISHSLEEHTPAGSLCTSSIEIAADLVQAA